MSWLYSQALVEEYLGENSSDGEQSVPSSGNHTQQAYCAPDKMTAFSRLSRFGMTFKPLTESRGEELLTLYLAGFHAKTSPLPEKAQELTESDQECGDTWRGWLAKYDQNSCLWRTAQCSLLEDLNESLEIFPKSGMTRNGLLWELPMLEPPTRETVFGFSVPTPVSSDATSGAVIGKNDTFYTTSTGLPRKINQNGKDGSVGLARLVQMWPTPSTKGYGHAAEEMVGNLITKIEEGVITKEEAEQMLSLPKLENHRTWKKKFSTPNTRNWKDTGTTQGNRKSPNLGTQVGGHLNPTWVEWLMGWPLGWTDLKPLATDKSLSVQQKHGDC
jgi:hypothetical protein